MLREEIRAGTPLVVGVFERQRASDPDWHHGNACALLADQAAEPV